jgi:hypothetical protein
MIDWKTSGIQIFSTLIGSSLVITGLTSLYNEFYNKPDIQIHIDETEYQAIVNIKNEGRISAHNLILSVNSSTGISNFNIHSTENYTLIQNGSTTLKIYVPRFSHGQGSLIIMNITYSEHRTAYPMTVYGTYDEGSLSKQDISHFAGYSTLFELFQQFAVTFEVFSLSALAFITPFLYRHLRQKGKRHQKQRATFIYEVIKEVMEVRGHLQNNLMSKRTFKKYMEFNSIRY